MNLTVTNVVLLVAGVVLLYSAKKNVHPLTVIQNALKGKVTATAKIEPKVQPNPFPGGHAQEPLGMPPGVVWTTV